MTLKDTLEVWKQLSEVADIDQINKNVSIYKQSRHKKAWVQPSIQIPFTIWQAINQKVKDLGGCWNLTREMWEVPLT